MSIAKIIAKAEHHRSCMEKAVTPLEKRLTKLLGIDVGLTFQYGDGWCVLLTDDATIIPVHTIDFNALWEMTASDARDYLVGLSI